MKQKYIICGKFFDGVNEDIQDNIKILTDGKKIQAVGKDIPCPADAKVVDLSEYTVTPGMIDSHVHYEFMDFTFNEFSLTDSEEMKALNTVRNCMTALQRGYTTIRTTGTAFKKFGVVDAKRAIERGMFPAARLLVAPHALGIPGGHWDFSTFYCNSNPDLGEFLEQSEFALGSGADTFKQLVRKQVKYGADFIKIMAAGGFASPGDDPGDPQLDDDELRAIINTSHMLSKKVTVHAYTSDVIEKLIEMGADEIEHGTLIGEHTAQMMLEHDTHLVPTLFSLMGDPNVDPSTLPPKAPAYQRKLDKYHDQLETSRPIIKDLIMGRKLTVGLGSDIVSSKKNIDGYCEFQAWRNIGIPALRIMVAGTSDNAKICGLPDYGVLAPGKMADIAAWGRDLIDDPDVLTDCRFVMKDGAIYKMPGVELE